MASVPQQSDLKLEKNAARKSVKALLKAAIPAELAQESQLICTQIINLPAFKNTGSVVSYLTCAKLHEVDTDSINIEALAGGKTLFVPIVEDSHSNMCMVHLESLESVVEVPPFGIREPSREYQNGGERRNLMSEDEDVPGVVIMPGLAFDCSGGRLGRGGGYYDKSVSAVMARADARGQARPVLMGLCFERQLIESVPMGEQDERVDWLITPQAVLDCRKTG